MTKKDLLAENKQLKAEKAQLEFRLKQLERMVFGSGSERMVNTDSSADQLSLFEQANELTEQEAPQTEQIAYTRNKSSKPHPGRNAFPSHLPVKEVVLEPEQSTEGMVKVREEITETLEYTPANLYVKKTIRPIYAHADGQGVVIASLPSRPLPKAIAEASLLTFILISKFVDHLPFYRQIQRFNREFGWEVSPSTINDWFTGCTALLEPLYNKLKEKILEGIYLQADESPIKVLDSEKKGKAHQGYQWVYYSPEKGLVLFDYRKGRGMHGPKEMLVDYKGYIQCDGYGVYDKIGKSNKAITLVGCLAHARRKFHEALDSDKKRAQYALDIFKEIYIAEKQVANSEDKTQYRLEHIKPLYDKLKDWAEEEVVKVIPKSPIAKALGYFINQWPKLSNVFEDGRLKLDNNLIENKIRPLALGRKNYLFAGSHDAAQRIAMMYSFIGTCIANGINPSEWLEDTLNKINETSIQDLEKLLPLRNEEA